VDVEDCELEALLRDTESDRVERKASAADGEKIRQAICAFANDLPNHRLPGVIFIGVNDDGSCAHLPITEQLLVNLSNMRSDGNILPLPGMTVQKRLLGGCEVAVITVVPADAPPVRYKGQVWVRVGPRRAIATIDEERRLAERRRSRDLPFDIQPVVSSELGDLDLDIFRRIYLPAAVAPEVLEQNQRPPEQQLVSLRFAVAEPHYSPTVLGIIVLGVEPTTYVPGAYVQFLRIDGTALTDPIQDQAEIRGPLPYVLRMLDDKLIAHIETSAIVTAGPLEIRRPDYPIVALQQLVRNAVLHRNYETSHAPVRITWFADRVEILNPGGPFGQVNRHNFGLPGITDYRNPHLAEAMKTLGYVQRFGVGIALARHELNKNDNPPLEFQVEESYVLATVRKRR
jgi:ATP-dependent DNA helicase RecG